MFSPLRCCCRYFFDTAATLCYYAIDYAAAADDGCRLHGCRRHSHATPLFSATLFRYLFFAAFQRDTPLLPMPEFHADADAYGRHELILPCRCY